MIAYPLTLLLSRLQAYGLCSNSLALLKSSFTNRKNRVRLGDTCGEWKAVKRGCPQGSSLGPVLCNFYQNDLFYENIRSQLSAYADDHQIYISGEKIDNVVSSLEEDGNTTGRWYKSPTTSRVIHRNINYWLCQEPSRKLRKRCTSMAIQFGRLKRLN